MAAEAIPRPSFNLPIVGKDGRASVWFGYWIDAVRDRLGGDVDKVDAAYQTAKAAAPQSRQVVAVGGLQAGGSLTDNVAVTFYVKIGPAASLPTLGLNVGDWAYATDGCKPGESTGAGTGAPVWWDISGAWFAVTSGAAVTT
jgi:hypothetical protein